MEKEQIQGYVVKIDEKRHVCAGWNGKNIQVSFSTTIPVEDLKEGEPDPPKLTHVERKGDRVETSVVLTPEAVGALIVVLDAVLYNSQNEN